MTANLGAPMADPQPATGWQRFLARIDAWLKIPLQWEESPMPPAQPAAGWGSFPQVSLLMAIGIVIISAGNIAARSGVEQAMLIYWIGLSLLVVPVTLRLASDNISSGEAVWLLAFFAVLSYGAIHLCSPLFFRGFDEALHWRTAYDILSTHHLFTHNSMLPVSPLYPGLESATSALVMLSGLTIYEAASVLLIFARLIMVLGLYFLYQELSGSVRVAGIATLIYTGSSTFMYFDAQFGYESLALPLVMLCLYMLIYRNRLHGPALWIWNFLVVIVLFAIVATHHMTTYAFTGILILWVSMDILTLLYKGQPSAPPWAAFLLVALTWVWVGVISTNTMEYLAPILNGAVSSFYDLIAGYSPPRQLFRDSSGASGAMLLERVIAILSVLLAGMTLPVGAWQWWLRYKKQALVTTLLVIALCFPLLPVMRLSSGAWDLANRASGFVFIGLGFIGGLALIQFPLPARWRALRRGVVVVSVAVIVVGGVIAGVSPGARVDQPYLPAAGSRSVDHESVMTGEWARSVLGPNSRMAADRTLTQVLGSYGVQRMITDLSDRISISGLFLRFELTPHEYDLIRQASIRYLVVDKRIATVLSTYAYYFESWEQTIVAYVPPVSLAVLEKFDHIAGLSRIYDSGNIVIYDLGALSHGQP